MNILLRGNSAESVKAEKYLKEKGVEFCVLWVNHGTLPCFLEENSAYAVYGIGGIRACIG